MEDKNFHIETCRINDALKISSQLTKSDIKEITDLYGCVDIVSLVERSILALRLTHSYDDDQHTKAIFIFDYSIPNWYDIKADVWTKVNQMTKLGLNSLNSIFLIYSWVDTGQDALAAYREVSRYVFYNNPDLAYILLYNEKLKNLTEAASNNLEVIKNSSLFTEKSAELYVILKSKVIEPISIRIAREEDQDDLSQICETQSELQRSLFGEFFLAELISSVSKDKICLVAESPKKKVLGLLVASDNVDYSTLIKNYELSNFKYLTKSDYYDEYLERTQLNLQLQDIRKSIEEEKEQIKFEMMKSRYSRDILLREVQEYCLINKDAMIQEFEIYLTDVTRQKVLNKNLVRRKLEKLFKSYNVVVPDTIFEKVTDAEIECCIQTPVDMVLEMFHIFGLDKNYMDGSGHWDEWIQRRIDEHIDDNKQKGLLGKKKRQVSKKHKDLNKDSKIQKPDTFDISPLYRSLEKMLLASQKTRQYVYDLFNEHKNDILELFCDQNGEIINHRSTTFDDIIRYLRENFHLEIDNDIASVIPYIFFAFGRLQYLEETITVKDRMKYKQYEEYIDILTQKKIRKINYHELLQSLEHLRKYDELFVDKNNYGEKIDQRFENIYNEKRNEVLESKNKDREFYSHFEDNSVDLESRFKNVPETVKDAVAINIFFIDEHYQDQAFKFLPHVFDYFSDKSYVVLNMPYTAPETPFLRDFIYIKQKDTSNFSQSLHLIHKYSLLKEHIIVEKHTTKSANNNFYTFDVTMDLGANCKFSVGKGLVEKNLAIKSLKSEYDVTDKIYTKACADNELLEIKELSLSPLFWNLHQFVMREMLYKTGSRIAYKHRGNNALEGINSFFDPLVKIKPQKLVDDINNEKPYDISILKLSSLWKPKMNINSRILVVGFTASAIGVINTILSNSQFNLRNIVILSQNFDWLDMPLKDKPDTLDYDIRFIQDYFINRTRMVRGKLLSINRKLKEAYVKSIKNEEFTIEYDYLILCNNLEEKTIDRLKQENKAIENVKIPEFIISVRDFNERFVDTIKGIQEQLKIQHVNYDWRSISKMMINKKNWVSQMIRTVLPSKIVLYGLSPELFILANDLVQNWHVQPCNILIVIPDDIAKDYKINDNNQLRLDLEEELIESPRVILNEALWDYYQNELERLGVNIIRNHRLIEFNETERSITLSNEELDMIKKPATTHNKSSRFSVSMTRNESLENNNMYIEDCVVILGNNYDIATNIFHTIQDNGLVYNGRLIVQANFKTVDDSIYAAGLICEFSQRYKNYTMGRSMRMDRYNQFEVGKHFANIFIEELQYDYEQESLPFLNGLLGFKAKILGGFTYINMYYPYLGKFDANQEHNVHCDNQLKTKGEYFSLTFDSNSILKELVYFGKKEVNHLALKNLMGLHKTYFNEMFERYESNMIESYIDYLNQAWADMLFHPLFNRFNSTLYKLLSGQLGLIDENNLPEEVEGLVTYGVYDFIKEHKKHFPNYYVQDSNYKL